MIGWAAFVIDEVVELERHSDEHVLTGHFVTFIATDLAAGNPITDPRQRLRRARDHADQMRSERTLP